MNLVAAAEMRFGGPGSGCRGDNCGRPGSGISDIHVPGVNGGIKVDVSTGPSGYRKVYRLSYEGREIGRMGVTLDQRTASIDQVSIDESMQRKGIGLELYKSVLGHLKSEGFNRLESQDAVRNKKSDGLWNKLANNYNVTNTGKVRRIDLD